MVIKNSTPWSTEDLRKLFRRCVKEVEKVEKPKYPFHKKNKSYQWNILNSTYSLIRGRALSSYPANWMSIKLPSNWEGECVSLENRVALARVIIHEYYHNLGFVYQDYNNYKHDFTKEWNVDWVKDYPISRKQVVQKAVVDIPLKRYQRAILNLGTAETRLKRAKTLERKWALKVKRYEKVYNFNNK